MVQSDFTVPASTRLESNVLLWTDYVDEDEETKRVLKPRRVSPGTGMLNRFVRLGDAEPPAILRYARRWGVLQICEHGLPASHRQEFLSVAALERIWCHPSGWPGECWEPLESWRFYANKAAAFLSISAQLRRDNPGDEELWERVIFWPKTNMEIEGFKEPLTRRYLPNEQLLPLCKRSFTTHLMIWLTIGGVKLVPVWRSDFVQVTVAAPNLFGALGVQLLFAASASEGLAICSSCKKPYVPKRRVRTNQRNYCEDCGDHAAWRHASREYRKRQKVLEELGGQAMIEEEKDV